MKKLIYKSKENIKAFFFFWTEPVKGLSIKWRTLFYHRQQSNLDFREAEKHVTGFKEVKFQLGALLWGTFHCTSAEASSTITHQHSDPLVSLPQSRWLMLLRRFWSGCRFLKRGTKGKTSTKKLHFSQQRGSETGVS